MFQNRIAGQYWPEDSFVHKLDPRTKLIGSLFLILTIFIGKSWSALGVCALFIFIGIVASKIPVAKVLRSILPLMFIVVITALINLFFVQGGNILVSVGFITISTAGVHASLFFSARLTLLLIAVSLLTLTTTNLDITEGFERILTPLTRLGVPAHELAMMMGIALRFLPLFIQEAAIIHDAQLSRGSAITERKSRIQGLSSLLVPLFTSVFRHAETLAYAMDSRCYHGARGRTRLHPLAFSTKDTLAALFLIAACLSTILVSIYF